jgi:HK97 family phage portal protein
MGLLAEIRDYVWPVGSAVGSETKSGAATLPAVGSPEYYNYLLGLSGGRSKAGIDVNLRTALGVSTVFACIKVISEGCAQVPCKIYRMRGDGMREEARDHPLWPLLYRKPNQFQTAFEFREQIIAHAALTGNAFIVVIPDGRGRPSELLPVEPGLARIEQLPDRSLRYWMRNTDRSSEVEIPPSMMWHLRGPSWNGWAGMDILRLARDSIGMAMATESFGSEMFANGVRLSGHLEIAGNPSPEVIENIRQTWANTYSGSGNRLQTALLTGGVEFKPHEIKADEAQYIETRKFLIPEICRFFRVMPIMVGHQDGTASYASVEQMFLAHRTHTLGPWFERFEQSAECALLSKGERESYEIELIEHGLTRGTARERAETLAILRQNGAITGNDMREAMDMPRVNEGVLNEFTPAANLFGPRETAPVE